MKWFKHSGNSLANPKIEELIFEYGVEGYGVYYAIVEIITDSLGTDNICFDLKHRATILSKKLNIDYNKLKKIINKCTMLNLLQINKITDNIACFKLAERLDTSTSNNIEFKKLILSDEFTQLLETNSNYKKLIPTNSRREEKTIEKNTKEKNKVKPPKHKHGTYNHVLLTDDELNKLQTKLTDYKYWIQKLDDGIELKGYVYKSHYLAILKWHEKDTPTDKKGMVKDDKDWSQYEKLGGKA